MITSIGTYLPRWGTVTGRQQGEDEDAVTLAVAAGLGALVGVDRASVREIVLVTRSLPLLEGGNGAVLVAALGLDVSARVREQIGGAPAVLDALIEAGDGTLVIGADLAPHSGAAAAFCGSEGAALRLVGRRSRSLPVVTRDSAGHRVDYADPRLVRVRGLGASLDALDGPSKFAAVAGLPTKDAAPMSLGDAPRLVTLGASAAIFALAALAERGEGGGILATEQATVTTAEFTVPAPVTVRRDEVSPRPEPKGSRLDGPSIGVSLPAYDRAFDAKLRLQADKCRTCGTLAYPHRFRCLECGTEGPTDTFDLPRDATVYTSATVHTPVPGLTVPYTLAVVELGDSGVRLLARVTGAPAGSVAIDDRGTLVLRLVAVRSGVPDYGYSFCPDEPESTADAEVAA